MSLGIVSGILGGLGSIATGAANTVLQDRWNKEQAALARENLQYQREANQANIDLQRETNAQNEQLMRESWARDDTAYQRKAADLEASGLSKTLAAGGSAMASSPVSLQAPRVSAVENMPRSERIQFELGNALQMSQIFADMGHQDRIDNLTEQQVQAQIRNTDADTTFKILNNDFFGQTKEARKLYYELQNQMMSTQLQALLREEDYQRWYDSYRKLDAVNKYTQQDIKTQLLDLGLKWYEKDKKLNRWKDIVNSTKLW